MSKNWVLGQIKPNSTQIALRNLKRQGFETFLPIETETLRSGNRFVTRDRPLFPGYIFIACDGDQTRWSTLNSTQGLSRLVSFGKTPARVPDDLVAALKIRCDTEGRLRVPPVLTPGAKVRLTEGPFANFIAEIEGLAPERRVWVLMDIMGGQTRVAVRKQAMQSV